jgi:hypothetical protein
MVSSPFPRYATTASRRIADKPESFSLANLRRRVVADIGAW